MGCMTVIREFTSVSSPAHRERETFLYKMHLSMQSYLSSPELLVAMFLCATLEEYGHTNAHDDKKQEIQWTIRLSTTGLRTMIFSVTHVNTTKKIIDINRYELLSPAPGAALFSGRNDLDKSARWRNGTPEQINHRSTQICTQQICNFLHVYR